MVTSWATYWAFLGIWIKNEIEPQTEKQQDTHTHWWLHWYDQRIGQFNSAWVVGVQLVIYFGMALASQVTSNAVKLSHLPCTYKKKKKGTRINVFFSPETGVMIKILNRKFDLIVITPSSGSIVVITVLGMERGLRPTIMRMATLIIVAVIIVIASSFSLLLGFNLDDTNVLQSFQNFLHWRPIFGLSF